MKKTKLFLTEGPQVPFKTADKYIAKPKERVPHNKCHSKDYTPDVKAPKGR